MPLLGCGQSERLSSSELGIEAARATAIADEAEAINLQAADYGGWDAWYAAVRPFQASLRRVFGEAAAREENLVYGRDGFVFARRQNTYLLRETLLFLSKHDGDRIDSRTVRAVTALNDALDARNIDLIFMPVPSRLEVYPEKLSSAAPDSVAVNPQCAMFFLELMKRGVEVVHLLPHFLEVRYEGDDLLALRDNMHWSSRGARVAAAVLAERLRRYEFVPGGDSPRAYRVDRRTTPGRSTWPRVLAQSETYEPSPWLLEVVLDEDGTPYQDVEDSPVLVAGDSYAGFFANVSAGVSAHLARELGMPVSLLNANDAGATLPRHLARTGAASLEGRRVIVWILGSSPLDPIHGQLWSILREGQLFPE